MCMLLYSFDLSLDFLAQHIIANCGQGFSGWIPEWFLNIPAQSHFSWEEIQSISYWYKLCQLAKEMDLSASKTNSVINDAKGGVISIL